MRQIGMRTVGFSALVPMILLLTACHKNQPPVKDDNHVRAVAVSAIGASYLLKQPERSIEYYQQAIQIEPNYRDWKSQLAFAYWKTHRTPEAVPLWQELAKGNDELASQAKHWLVKVGAKP